MVIRIVDLVLIARYKVIKNKTTNDINVEFVHLFTL